MTITAAMTTLMTMIINKAQRGFFPWDGEDWLAQNV
jgi:hypothetical protein